MKGAYKASGGLARSDSVSSRVAPRVQGVLVDNSVISKPIGRIVRSGIVFHLDVLSYDLSLHHGVPPVLVHPRQLHLLLSHSRLEQGIGRSSYVEVDSG